MMKLGYLCERPEQAFFDLSENKIIIPDHFTYSQFDSENYRIKCYGRHFFLCKKGFHIFHGGMMWMPYGEDAEKVVNIVRQMGFEVLCRRNRYYDAESKCPRKTKCRVLTGVIEADMENYFQRTPPKEAEGPEIQETDDDDKWIDYGLSLLKKR